MDLCGVREGRERREVIVYSVLNDVATDGGGVVVEQATSPAQTASRGSTQQQRHNIYLHLQVRH